jgi:hypothetical protein
VAIRCTARRFRAVVGQREALLAREVLVDHLQRGFPLDLVAGLRDEQIDDQSLRSGSVSPPRQSLLLWQDGARRPAGDGMHLIRPIASDEKSRVWEQKAYAAQNWFQVHGPCQ